MRRILVLSIVLFAAACAPRPQATTTPVPTPQPVPQPTRQSSLFGSNIDDLVGHFGKPVLQIHEGSSVKLQFRGRACVLDAYLYPSRDGQLRVTYVDTRRPAGTDIDQATCISALESQS
jgi:hypothetical protein